MSGLQPRVYRLALERQHRERALVNAAKWLLADEALETLDAQSELAEGERALGAEAAATEAVEVRGLGVLGAVDDAEVLATAALERGLREAAGPRTTKSTGLTTIPSPPPFVISSHHAVARAWLSVSVVSTTTLRVVASTPVASAVASPSTCSTCQVCSLST